MSKTKTKNVDYESPYCEMMPVFVSALLCQSDTLTNPVFDPEEEFEM